ncbi:hypothetical protein GCM10007304_22000 [Rhodococcoides trifolii]|uniref:Peroxide stress protein YaaA n=1 Tax=Rhodococcoides trifolii TaxID=908250 RepID=A0A917D4K3_9NOCA|nr:peroxide stress protein YaaA [Rhodococcus trifolii]GGG07551.1 hypothetical protein GCM10007304_22000 [Rhodococcus trifolii]
MLVLLPPSETKSDGGRGVPLDLDRLWLPELTSTRRTLVDALVALSADVDASRAALGISPKQLFEVERNAALLTSPTAPALARYTGVLYDALGASAFTKAQRARADARIAIGSALFGALRATDPVPAYRLSGGSTLPGLPTLRALWKPDLSEAITAAAEGLIVDLRSGTYQQLGPIAGAVTATVLTEQPDGSRSVVSHFNKHHKGLLARALTVTRAEPSDARSVARVASKAGLRVEVASPNEVVVLTDSY